MGKKRLTTELFIKRSDEIHKNKYDYSLVEYINCKSKVKIICKKHGIFEQIPLHHLKGTGCPKCCGMNKSIDEIKIEFNQIHNNFYDYSLFTNYTKSSDKINITCPLHGVFQQSVNSHLSGHGCKKCSNKKISDLNKFDTDIFITKSNLTHNNFYDYSLAEYINCKTKIKIICPLHGIFEQIPSQHIKGQGCPKCGFKKIWINRKIQNEDFISKCNKIHKNKYDYSLVEYKDAKKKIKIICPIHGEFEQTPNSHLRGCGCPKCKNRMFDKNTFISKSNKIHNNKYDYNMVEFIDSNKLIKIICKKHGEFQQTPKSHLRCGCPKCSLEKQKINSDNQKIGLMNFIKRSNEAHNNKYDYSLAIYINCKTKIKIICPLHGIFEQIPDHHYRGVGCPECSKTYGGKFSDRFLYIFYDYNMKLMKIGSSKNPEKRMKEISKGKDSSNLKLIKKYSCSALLENKLHKYFNEFNIMHNVYDDGKTEWFNLSLDDLDKIDDFIQKENAR